MSFTVPEVHSASTAVLELPTTPAWLCFLHPTAIAEDFEPHVPDLHEVILVDVSLIEDLDLELISVSPI